FLPWLLLLGAPGSGKTSLAMGATLHGGGLRAATETPWRDEQRQADIEAWISDDAVWLDTHGRWTLPHDDDSGARSWFRLLHGVRRLRSRPALNGVVICVAVRELLDTPPESRKRLAESLRGRLADVCDLLDQRVDVFIALTGLDRLDGAVSFLSMMDVDRWGLGLGMTLDARPDGEGGDLATASWRKSLLDLERRVQQQVLFAAPASGDISLNVQQLRFVETLARLRGPLLDLLQWAIAPGDAEASAALRGVWFGSVAQIVDDAPVAVDQGVSPDELPARLLSQLWSPLYRQATTYPEGGSRPAGRRSWRARLGAGMRWGALATATALCLGWIAAGYLRERDNLERLQAQFTEAKRLAKGRADGVSAGSALIDAATQMRYAREQAETASQLMPTTYVEHRRVAVIANETYHRHLERTLMPEIYNAVQQTLVAQVAGSPGDLYQTLKIYLMLSRPQRRSPDELERWISARWESLSGGQYADEDRRVLIEHARALFALPALPATPENAELVRSARVKAAQTPSVARVLQHIRSQGLPPNVSDISLARAAGYGSSLSLRMRSNLPATDPVVQGWYTRAGYLDTFLPRLSPSARAILEEESWVLRDERLTGNAFEIERTVEKLADATRNQFLQDYVQKWQAFLNDVTVRRFTGLDDASQLAATLIDPQSPLAQLLRFAGRETSLTGNYEGDVDSWIDRQKQNIEKGRRAVVGEVAGEHYRVTLAPEKVVEDHFSAIRTLATQLTQSGGANNPMARLFEPVSRQLGLVNGAMQAGQVMPEYDAFSRLRGDAGRQPEPVRGIMLDLINNGSSMTAKESSGMLTRGAAGATRALCDQGLAGRYPLIRNARTDAGVQDYERLFGPQGVMATHFKEQLAPYVDTAASPWRARQPAGGNAGPLIGAEILRSYEAAERIRAATLDESGRLRVATLMRFVEMDPQLAEAQLDVGDQTLRYAHGLSAPTRIDWQSKAANLSIRLKLRAIDGRTEILSFDGPWALWRFFDAGREPGGTAERRETRHRSSLGSVQLEWQAATTPSPIWSDLLSGFRCPR
ncbi:MAG: type VI secretion system membrane subunit TssM, partial [Pseudomonadota bacterium]|nr:type VI secretion system membrane subunit TssM [Pseudomonadota bacterium]